MTLLAWHQPVLTRDQRAQLRRELYLSDRLHLVGLRAAIAALALGAICILAGQTVSQVSLDGAWVSLVGLAITAGLVIAAAPLAVGFGGGAEHSLDGEGIRLGGQRRRIAWAKFQGYWTATSPQGLEVLHLLTRHGRHIVVDLPSPPLARTVENLLRVHIRELPPSDRRLLPTSFPTWLGILSYTIIVLGGAASALITFQIPHLGPDTGIVVLSTASAPFALGVVLLWRRLYSLPGGVLLGLASLYFMAIFMLGCFFYAALVARTFQSLAAGA